MTSHSFLRIPYVSVSAHPRHIQRGMVFAGEYHTGRLGFALRESGQANAHQDGRSRNPGAAIALYFHYFRHHHPERPNLPQARQPPVSSAAPFVSANAICLRFSTGWAIGLTPSGQATKYGQPDLPAARYKLRAV